MKHKIITCISLIVTMFLLIATPIYADTEDTSINTRVLVNNTPISEADNIFQNANTITITVEAHRASGLKYSRATFNSDKIEPYKIDSKTVQIKIRANQLKKDSNTLSIYYIDDTANLPVTAPVRNDPHLALINFILGLSTIAMGIVTLLVHNQTEELYQLNKHYRLILIVVSIAMSVFSSFFFLGTNTLFGEIRVFDQWTLLMFIFFVDQVTMTIVNYKITRAGA